MNPGSSTFDPAGFITCAKYLQNGAFYGNMALKYDEARLRSAINRAYVGAFCAARNHLLDKGQLTPQSANYMQVRNAFQRLDQRHKKIADDLEKLRRKQMDADYERLPFPMLVGTAYLMINKADHILNTLPQL